MNRTIILFLGVSLSAFGMSYQAFKRHTLKHAKVLQSQALSKRVTQEKNNILLRTANPTLELELSKFNPQGDSSSYEYSAIVSQNIRTDNYYHALTQKANAQEQLTSAYIKEGEAGFLKTLENLYTDYVYQSKLLSILKEEYRLSQKVSRIVNERYKNGSETKVSYLQVKTDTMRLKTQMFATKQELNNRYYQLIAAAGLSKKVDLEKRFIYRPSKVPQTQHKLHPKQEVIQAKRLIIESQLNMNKSIIDSYALYGGVENEPDQSILKVGISVPIPMFNNKSEERSLARLKMQQLHLDNEQLQLDIKSQKEMIRASIKELNHQYRALEILRDEQLTLSKLLQEGYALSQGSIFVMMNAKNRLIQTRKALLQTQRDINKQKILYRYLQGDYND
jgi:outer membrane protein TolC